MVSWKAGKTIGSANIFISPNVGWLGINAENPSAQLHIVAQDERDILRVDSASGLTFLRMDAGGRIGLNAGINHNYDLNVGGIINASDIYLNG